MDTHPVSLLLIEKNGKFLMAKRTKKPLTGFWSFPGGHVDKGETPLQAAHRELKEETNLEADIEKEVHVSEQEVDIGHRHVCHVFKVSKIKGKEHAGDDVKNMDWFTLDEIKKLDLTHLALRVFNDLYFSK
jgi:8-oxo-dGTP diphosphatase